MSAERTLFARRTARRGQSDAEASPVEGKAHYLAALANPEDAAKGVSPDEPFENHGMWYAASRAWAAKTGKPSDEYYAIAPNVVRQIQGEPWDEETVYEKYPRLAKKFGGG